MNVELLLFLKENAHFLCASPINGCRVSICSLFNGKACGVPMSQEEFDRELCELQEIDRNCIEYSLFKDSIVFINELNLGILIETLSCAASEEAKKLKRPKAKASTSGKSSRASLANRLSSLLDEPLESEELSKLRELLNYESTGHRLSKKHLALTTPRSPFLPTCNDPQHSTMLASSSPVQLNKLPKDLRQCLNNKIHFIPMIKAHTDVSLGDCSYLDTCHKLDSCRYVHYTRHVPHERLSKELAKCEEFNDEIAYWERISPWMPNGSVSNLSRETLPPQWINCDVRTFDFTTLGKFAAVIADPAWNIHMNLPYGTCNDTELLNLPLHTIQDEGVLFLWVTGRAIEIGKASLMKWGYKIKNEVIWVKTNQLSRTICTGRTGHWLNHSKEHLFVGVKGEPEWLDRLNDVDVMVSSTRETSRKPDELYGMIERLVGPHARKLEIFGRDHNTRPGWLSEYTLSLHLTSAPWPLQPRTNTPHHSYRKPTQRLPALRNRRCQQAQGQHLFL